MTFVNYPIFCFKADFLKSNWRRILIRWEEYPVISNENVLPGNFQPEITLAEATMYEKFYMDQRTQVDSSSTGFHTWENPCWENASSMDEERDFNCPLRDGEKSEDDGEEGATSSTEPIDPSDSEHGQSPLFFLFNSAILVSPNRHCSQLRFSSFFFNQRLLIK